MFSVSDRPVQCIECEENSQREGWYVCQECQRTFCSRHSITHRHQTLRAEQAPSERYNRHVHLDQIAEWERRAIDKIRKQADEARRPLIAPPTPMIATPPSLTLVNESSSDLLTRLMTASSNFEKQSPVIDPSELLSDETLDDIIGNHPLTSPPDEVTVPGRVSFASQYPYMTGVHRLRLSIDRFNAPSSWAFVGIVSEGLPFDEIKHSKNCQRTSFGWHVGRQSIVYNRQTSAAYSYDGRDTRASDILTITIDCNESQVEVKNERTLRMHRIAIDQTTCPSPWLFAVNFNYKNKDTMHLLQ